MRVFVLILILSAVSRAQTPENVLLVLNETSAMSLDIGQYYAQKRGIPAQNILRLKMPATEEISHDEYARQIEAPISAWLARNSAQDRILYFVLTKGVPLRIRGTSGQKGTVASVDSELALLYARMVGIKFPEEGAVGNPYYLANGQIGSARQFNHQRAPIYLVSRLDGYNFQDIKGLIDRGSAPVREGKILLDQKAASGKGDDWLKTAADWMNGNGFKDRVVLDSGPNVLRDQSGVLGYYSWGSNDPAIKTRTFNLRFSPGALAAMFVSSDGRTFSEPPANWMLGTWEDAATHFGGSPQSLAGDLIHEGATGVAGHVAEPYLEYTIRPNILFPVYLSGFNLIESFYMAMPALSWQTVVVGDPLCAPFRTQALAAQDIDKGIDPETELPGYFSAYRLRPFLQSAGQPGTINEETGKLFLKAEARMAKQNAAGARQALEEITAKDNNQAAAHFLLATLYEQAKEYDKSDERYRRVLELTPDNPVALNNLAYSLAVRRNRAQEALPLAEKASRLAGNNANIQDTLGWIYHLTGADDKAIDLTKSAVQKDPNNAEMHLHLATLLAAQGQTTEAQSELTRSLALNPNLESAEEVKTLRAKLLPNPDYS
jgi:uncharacterized protein (TIGR03790 family)